MTLLAPAEECFGSIEWLRLFVITLAPHFLIYLQNEQPDIRTLARGYADIHTWSVDGPRRRPVAHYQRQTPYIQCVVQCAIFFGNWLHRGVASARPSLSPKKDFVSSIMQGRCSSVKWLIVSASTASCERLLARHGVRLD